MSAARPKKVGILALQGCVEPHVPHIEACGAEVVRVRKASDLQNIDGLILPGGESTTMLKLLNSLGMKEALQKSFDRIPCWGICAGAILMAKEVSHPKQESFGALDIAVARNAYGRHLESFNDEIAGSEVSFIRAPRIEKIGTGDEVLGKKEGEPVWVSQGRHMATTFHPELASSCPSHMHRFFVDKL